MSLKCSILGHRFDETAVERDREEDGSEVVTTITELETCSRCGETRVVSENTEVTTMETPTDVDASAEAGVVDAGADIGADVAGADAGADVEGDDAEILDSGSDVDDPEANAQAQARTDSTPIPDAESGEATGPADAPVDEEAAEDAVIIDGDTGDERDPGEWPDETTRDVPEEGDEGPPLERSASPTTTVPEGMYRCSDCGFTTEVESSSLRAGDFCPECHTGALVQHDDAG
jgi:DNA-directed RNA polymerase subunit RPC12/RpoP